MNKFAIALLLLLVSCGRENSKTFVSAEHTVIVDESGINTKRKASDIFSEITIVPLETSDNCLMGNINKIVSVGDTLFLQDNKSKSIFIFDRSGKFLKKIHRHGRGPGEYITLDDFTVTQSGKIIILDGEYKKLIFLNKDGEYISQQALPIYVNALECVDDNLIVFNGSSSEDRVILWDLQKEQAVTSYIGFDIKYACKIFKPLIKYGDNIYFNRANSSVIHNVTVKELEEKWFIDFGKRNIDLNKMIRIPQWGIYANPPNAADIDHFTETDKYISFSFQCEELDEYPYYMFYSKSSGKQIFFTFNHYQDDMIFNKYPPDAETATASGEFVAWTMPLFWRENVSSYNPENMKGKELDRWNTIQRQMENISDFDNPLLIFFTLKDF